MMSVCVFWRLTGMSHLSSSSAGMIHLHEEHVRRQPWQNTNWRFSLVPAVTFSFVRWHHFICGCSSFYIGASYLSRHWCLSQGTSDRRSSPGGPKTAPWGPQTALGVLRPQTETMYSWDTVGWLFPCSELFIRWRTLLLSTTLFTPRDKSFPLNKPKQILILSTSFTLVEKLPH